MNKEHLETDLTIKASCKVKHIVIVDNLQIAPFFVHREVDALEK